MTEQNETIELNEAQKAETVSMRADDNHEVQDYVPTQSWKEEIKALLVLGTPMALTQLVQFSVNTIDVLMIGKLGPEALAASSLGIVIYYFTWIAGFGPMMAISPLISQCLGADPSNTKDPRAYVRMGLWAIVFTFPIMFLIYLNATPISLVLGQPEQIARAAGPYVIALAPGLPFALGVFLLRNFLATIERTRVPLYIIVGTTILNAFFNWVLIYGNLGFPALELVGAGIASALCHLLGFVFLVVYIYLDKRAAKFKLFENFFRPHWERFMEILRLGWPISVTMGFEVMLFNISVFLMGRIGVDEMAAYQVALNIAALAFMMPLGFSMAGCVRVGLAVGAGDMIGVRRAAYSSILVAVGAIMTAALIVITLPNMIAGAYLDASDPENEIVLKLIVSFLPIAAAFMFFDGIQVAASQALRGLKDVDIPMYLCGFSYWLVGFTVAYYLGLETDLEAKGVWYGLLAALLTASILLGGRLVYLLRK